ncbi:anti-sigma regulatory factor (Ser/Thr protein kinase) [Spinactinospora alkalitolerans]|uniref:Anti-sigma regulatory factor (Ser/Thr protein kinase) n=1 Tax=Spinactinospora alkalitolerans TaxID=687207 RepID=A0A852TYI2_9ACTN|nr:ATP-binding protein [Spinactinospora alkalitolerans]NYE48395.1 anti-sigma regulatory factor (Ser/Thr protein kinase) [Spinactinospora alkalitolerans]
MTTAFGHSWHREFAGEPDSVKAARDWLDKALSYVGVPDELVATSALLLSELATNAVLHTRSGEGGTFEAHAFYRHGAVRVEVHDAGGDTVPTPRTPGPESTTGRGLVLVEAFSNAWGTLPPESGTGLFFEVLWASTRERGRR